MSDQNNPIWTCWARMAKGFAQSSNVTQTLPPGIYEFGAGYEDKLEADVREISTEVSAAIGGTMQAVLDDADQFWLAGDAYLAAGFPWKRGFLLYGASGSGKSATVRELARRTVALGGLVALALADKLSDLAAALPALAAMEPRRLLTVIIEDIEQHCGENNRHSESELLTLTDGELRVPDGTLFVATTNTLQAIPARLSDRRSRFDRVFYFGPPDVEQRLRYLEQFWPKTPAGEHQEASRAIADFTDGLSLADLKEVVLRVKVYGESAELAVDRTRLAGRPNG